MFVEVLSAVAGPTCAYAIGDVVDWPDDEAEKGIASGIFSPLTESGAIKLSRARGVPIRTHRIRDIENKRANEPKSTLGTIRDVLWPRKQSS